MNNYSNIKIENLKNQSLINLCLILIGNNLKQEGESCGSSRAEVCGICSPELDCNAPFDACGQCVKKPGKIQDNSDPVLLISLKS